LGRDNRGTGYLAGVTRYREVAVRHRFGERNPVGAGLVRVASDWPWSSAAMHCGLGGSFDLLNIDVRGQDSDPLIWRARLGEELDESELMTVRWAVHRGEALPTDPRLVA